MLADIYAISEGFSKCRTCNHVITASAHPLTAGNNCSHLYVKPICCTIQDGAAHGSPVALSAVVFMFLLVCPVFSYIPAISFTRDELLDIRQYTPLDISPVFDYSDVLLDIVVGGAVILFRRSGCADGGSEPARSWSSDSADFGQHCLATIWWISALYPTKRTNSFCSPGQIRIFKTLLLCVSRKPGWMTPFPTAR